MDTQSEQAPHTGSGIGNDSCNISHLGGKDPFALISTQSVGPLCQKCPRLSHWEEVCTASCGHWRGYLLLAPCNPQRWVTWYFPPHLVFVVSPWRDDLYYLGQKIKEAIFALIPWSLHLTSPENQPWLRNCLTALQNVVVKLNSGKTASLFMLSLQFTRNRALDPERCNKCFLKIMHTPNFFFLFLFICIFRENTGRKNLFQTSLLNSRCLSSLFRTVFHHRKHITTIIFPWIPISVPADDTSADAALYSSSGPQLPINHPFMLWKWNKVTSGIWVPAENKCSPAA